MTGFLQDIRYAGRALARSPGFAAAAVLTLALGIGANTAIFSVVDAVLLRPLPFPEADRLVVLWGRRGSDDRLLAAAADLLDYRARSRTLEDIGLERQQSVNWTGGGPPDRLAGAYVSANVLPMLGVRASRGRLFRPEEAANGTATDVAILSYATWRDRFGADPAILGRSLTLDGRPREVIGVAGEGAADPFVPVDVWLPIGRAPSPGWFDRGTFNVWAYAVRKPGSSAADVQRELSGIAADLARQYPRTNAGAGATVVPLREQVVGATGPILLTVLAFVGVVLLIACANVASLQLARAEGRRRELAVRAALGASRPRLVRQMLVESLVLSASGAGLGLLGAVWAIRALAAAVPGGLPAFGAVQVDPRTVLLCAFLTIGTALAFGLVPALRHSRADLAVSLAIKPGQSRGGRGLDARDVLVAGQLALCIVLLAGAGLLGRSLRALERADPGFAPERLLTAEFRLPAVKYGSPERITQFLDRALERVRAVPGIASAALVRSVPLTGNFGQVSYAVEGAPAPPVPLTAEQNTVSPNFFATFSIPLLEGRDFSAADRADAPNVVVVNRTLAHRAWPGRPALGRRVKLLGPPDAWATVIGVVGDIRQRRLTDPPTPQIYQDVAQAAGAYNSVAVRASSDPAPLVAAVREAIWSVDRDQPVWRGRPMAAAIAGQSAQPRFSLALTGAFALLALVLACVGVYGVMAHVLAQRTREMGIRVALGAQPAQIFRLALGRGVRVVLAASAVGLAGASAATRLLRGQLFGVGTSDPLTFTVVPLILAAVALAACALPARRAARVDPMVALRTE